eukprot:maker-scaffold_11-snap-gene-12.10-mRNA-1 protein AED:0.00 eAED:0.00 QI:191/1/1/1/1/1/2/110/417
MPKARIAVTRTTVVRLGLQDAPRTTISDSSRERKKRFLSAICLLCCCYLLIFCSILLAILFPETDSPPSVPGTVTFTPTSSPNVPLTPRPTASPTLFPTTASPTTPTIRTSRPTASPSQNPTFGDCETPDAQCGCNLVTSSQRDIIFVVDSSSSIGQENYNLMTGSILNFVKTTDPPFDPVNGTRFGYVQFNDPVEFSVDMSTFITLDQWTRRFASEGGGGPIRYNSEDDTGTNHLDAISEVRRILIEESPARETAQVMIVMISDGNPCIDCNKGCYSVETGEPIRDFFDQDCNAFLPEEEQNEALSGGCCVNSLQVDPGIQVLKDLRSELSDFIFTFFYLPVSPEIFNPVANLTLFDAVVDDDGLDQSEYKLFPLEGYDLIEEFLRGESLETPLGPCIEPPTSSGSSRRLFSEDSH